MIPAARLLVQRGETERSESFSFLDLTGQLAELSEELPCGALTFTSELIWAAQQAGEPVGWVSARPGSFYPPDLAANGIDASAITVVTVPGEREAIWASDLLLRSGAFGFLIVDLEEGRRLADGAMARLIHLARRHRSAVLFLTVKKSTRASVSPLVALRGVVDRRRGRSSDGRPQDCAAPFVCEITTVKDKRGAPGRRLLRVYDGPTGVC